jgi:hypothetical protein
MALAVEAGRAARALTPGVFVVDTNVPTAG